MTTTASTLPRQAAVFHFHTTRWSRVCLAKTDSVDGQQALADLCEAYYEPVLAFLRCELQDAEAARDLSHAFFAEILEGGAIQAAAPERGRFRSYLLGAVKHFTSHHREHARRMKRGAGLATVTLDSDEALGFPDAAQRSPDAVFDRQWAITVLARGLAALRAQCEAERRIPFFELVKPLLTGDALHGAQGELAIRCGMSLPAFRMAVHRLKKQLRLKVHAEVAGTLEDPAMVQQEMQALYAALAG
ncbi:MAG: RNA polymerase sigma factor [Verrucomicrobium sp.]|nr:sigma-70 family RNA polymerase sigma factor [Verrucomicrobium sp.]